MTKRADARIAVDLPEDGTFGGFREEVLHAAHLETGLFEVLNVPLLANGIHVHDIVRCKPGAVLPRVEAVVEPGGWGTLHVIVQPSFEHGGLGELLVTLRAMGGLVERGFDVVAVGFPPGNDPEAVMALLNPLAERGDLVFELEM